MMKVLGISLLCLGLCVTSCTDKFEEYNTNPDEVTEEMLAWDMLGLGGFFPTMQIDVVPTSDVDANEYQRAQNLAGDIFSGYMAAIGQWNGSVNNSTYNLYYADWNDVMFNVANRSVMSPWQKIKEKSEEYGMPNAYYLAQIIKIEGMHRVTDNYGPIPYSKFGTSAMSIPYDSQESIYKSFLVELSEAIEELEEYVASNPNSSVLSKYDLIYGGDWKKWIVFANSLKLRLAMRISYVEPALAKQYAQEAVNSTYGVMQNNSDNAILKSALGYVVTNPLQICWDSYADTRMGASMESFMSGYNDPRLPVYFQASAAPYTGYHGVRNGITIDNKSNYSPMSAPNVFGNTPVQWMCAAEIYFLRAEGAIRGWNMGGTAEDLYNQGIQMSFEQRGLSTTAYTAYVNDNTSAPANFVDPRGKHSIAASTTIKIKWDDTAGFETKLERILTQKWLAIYPDGQEAWTEFRRTGYPKIFPVAENKSNGTINTNQQIRRITYPKTEYQTNETELRKAIAELLGGNDNGGTKLWWDKK
ncbi:RagB/SusD family nutrient uptake outer membrane protein [Dysgonomonas sp. 25]|uniref:RagB/SusD family nutrient uptake outer membrane protein n=1 Tax=Dysgonomonas sp. 25 TaxID=2302933 RepID=UPI0013D1A7D6|nr:RagB/SusD family nutrient uptake outer membrane protein [Dysgonomonas sp. 25]NDV70169.1 SusD/RagB family nutrient-binding outer membrane lipoprotein [Dysgonomonas sp. 25]